MKKGLFLVLFLLAGCSSSNQPSNSGGSNNINQNVYLTWSEYYNVYGCTMDWYINGNIISAGSSGVTGGTGVLLLSNLPNGSYPVSLSYGGGTPINFKGTLTMSGSPETITVSEACGPNTNISIP